MRRLRTHALVMLLLLAGVCTAAEQPRRLGHYVHQRWVEGSEAPVPVVALAQGRDGFIWLATGDGLFRFDGLRFEAIEIQPRPRKFDPPSTVLVTAGGEVWTQLETSRRFAVYRHGRLQVLDAPAAPSRIVEMVEGHDGAIYALTSNYNAQVMRFQQGKWRTFNTADGLPPNNAYNMLVARDGSLWLACRGAVVRLRPGAERFETVHAALYPRISQDHAGRLWLASEDRIYAITGEGGRGAAPAHLLAYDTSGMETRGAPLFDRAGNVWVSTRYAGVRRFAASGASPLQGDVAESFTSRDGLSSDVANRLLEDREGNIWVATEGGLDRFRAATLVAEPALAAPAMFGDKLLAGADGTVYIGQARTLYRVLPGGSPQPLIEELSEPEALCQAGDGALWIALRTEIVIWANQHVRQRLPRPDQDASHNYAYDCSFDAQGSFWMSAAGGGVHRYRQGRWEKMFDAGYDPDFYPTTLVGTPAGGVVVQSGNRLIWWDAAGLRTTPLDFGQSDLKVLTLERSGQDLYAAGAFGLTRWRNGRADTAWAAEVSHASRINGLVRTPAGELWLAYPKALVRMSAAQLEHALARHQLGPPALSLGAGDGLISRPHSHSQRALVRGGDGRLWLATETGTLWMDPARIVRNPVPPGVVITALRDDERSRRDPQQLRLPTGTTKIEIDYAVLSFADQQRVQVRYRLHPFDRHWVYPGQRRQAFYTNLPPGKYRFQVTAANDDGVWNPTGAVLQFELPRPFLQSVWFALICLIALVIALLALHRLQVAQAARRVQARLEERHAERERIARELHDTLLQGVMGLILRFQAVANRITGSQGTHDELESALAAADAVVDDARKRVWDLRSASSSGDVCAMLEQVVAHTPFDPPISVRVVLEGQPCALHPLVLTETCHIVREGLLNIAHHARARSAEVAVGFEARHFAVRIRDDGIGIPDAVLQHGHKPGHFGLLGMRERAERIGGELRVSSSAGQGAEVTLILPARLAYARARPRRRLAWPRWRLPDRSDD